MDLLPVADIQRCGDDPEFLAAMESLYALVDAEVSARKPVCINRGECCNFGRFGHRLFVTPAELAYFEIVTPIITEHNCTIGEAYTAGWITDGILIEEMQKRGIEEEA